MPVSSNRIKKCLVVAKYDFYLRDVICALYGKDLELLTANSSSRMQELINLNPDIDIIFFPHYSEIVPSDIFEKFLCIGFHTGNLPRGRGGSPIQHQILEGDYFCPISAIQINRLLDSGPIYLQKEIDLSEGNILEILQRASLLIASMVEELVAGIPKPRAQEGEHVIRKRLTALDSRLNVDALTTRQIYDRIRMLDGLDYPRAYIDCKTFKLLLSSAELENNELKFISRIERK